MDDAAPDAETDAGSEPAGASGSTVETATSADPPSLGSRILVTWAGLTAVGVVGGLLSATVGDRSASSSSLRRRSRSSASCSTT